MRNMNIIKTPICRFFSAILFCCLFLLTACEKEDDGNSTFDIDEPVQLMAFNIAGVTGEIDQNAGTIQFQLPYGISLNSITPVISLPEGATITPGLDEAISLAQPVTYTVVNGNLYKDYMVSAKVNKPISSFTINGNQASINDNTNSISVTLQGEEVDVTNLQPGITLTEGVSTNLDFNSPMDFSQPVSFTVTGQGSSETYTITVSTPNSGSKMAFLGVAASRSEITDPDEKAAADWFFSTYGSAEYLSFQDIKDGESLDYSVIWWHYDSSMELPGIALDGAVTEKLKTFYADGGGILLSTFAARYVEALDLVPDGKGPNNVFGDFLPNGFVDENNSWGISFKTRTEHPVFQGLETFEEGKAKFLEKGTFRLNHTAWWFLPEWGGYGNGAGWREQTGGINLASEDWDDTLDGRVAIAEFPADDSDGNAIVIAFGAYDWYNETNADGVPSAPNGFLSNIQQLTRNSIDYLEADEQNDEETNE